MEVARLGNLCNLGPLVLGDLIDFTLFGSLIGVLGAYSEDIVLCAILMSLVEMSKLMARTTIVHISASFSFIGFFVDGKTISSDHCADFILLLLTSDTEYLVVNLDRYEIFGKDIGITQGNLLSRLRDEFVDHHLTVCSVIIVETRFVLTQNKIRLEADYVMEETSELVDFRANNDVGSSVVGQVFLMTLHLLLQTLTSFPQITDLVTKLEHGKELALLGQIFLIFDPLLQVSQMSLHRLDRHA